MRYYQAELCAIINNLSLISKAQLYSVYFQLQGGMMWHMQQGPAIATEIKNIWDRVLKC